MVILSTARMIISHHFRLCLALESLFLAVRVHVSASEGQREDLLSPPTLWNAFTPVQVIVVNSRLPIPTESDWPQSHYLEDSTHAILTRILLGISPLNWL